jgi:hypothetical protein
MQTKRGQALAELAIMVPFLVIAMMGLLDLGRAYYYQISLTNATREGARLAVGTQFFGPPGSMTCSPGDPTGPTCPFVSDAAIKQRVLQELNGTGITLDPAMIVIVPNQSQRIANFSGSTTAYPLSVQASFSFSLLTPIIANLVGNPVTIVASSAMRTEY